MLPPVCFTCGHLLADMQIPFENDLIKIENDPKLNEKEKSDLKATLLDKYHVKSYCCRSRVLTYIKLIDIIT
jgi:DNA-directed RNA polymerase subunit N (RpoN/RPB10)